MVIHVKFRMLIFSFCVFVSGFMGSCESKKNSSLPGGTDLQHENQKQLTEVIIYDVFSPPVASRIYAYTSLAAYEAIRFSEKGYPSIAAQLNEFPAMPEPENNKHYDFNLAATKAFFAVAHKVVFSLDTLKKYEDRIFAEFKESLDPEVYDRSVLFGEAIGAKVLERSANDNYKKTRGMRKYLGSKEDGKWQPTSPDYMDGVEPFFHLIKPFALDSAGQCGIAAPPAYSRDTNSAFFQNTLEVYRIGNSLTDSQKIIIQYWDDNPFVVEHSGHMMFANKKITPGGHWMGIATIASKKDKAGVVKTAQVYALTAISLLDAFISCWDGKYKTEVVRPITVIHKLIDERWQPFLQTPPFPEYPSGHSAISAAAATVLTSIYGENFSFHDDSDKAYIGMERDFTSFHQAAAEAAISRVYGGIHYRTGMDAGAQQGKAVAKVLLEKIKLKDQPSGTN